MPANLTAEAQAKWQAAQLARNPKEKLQAYQDFLSAIPKHKGNERLRAQVKTKIAELKEEITARHGKRASGRSSWQVEREGAAQVVMVGLTNSGRSSLLRALTNAQVAVGSYAYTTQRPVPGMLQHEDIQLQLVELPALQPSGEGGYRIPSEALDLLRSSDGLIIVVDLSANPLEQLQSVTTSLQEARISTQKPLSRVEIVKEKGSGEIRIATSGTQRLVRPTQIRELLHSYGIKNALVRIYGDATVDDVEDAVFENATSYKPSVLIGNKVDLPGAIQASLDLRDAIPQPLPTMFTSCLTGQGLKSVGGTLFQSLEIIRVYTKEPTEPKPSRTPFVIRAGSTVGELAKSIHSDLANRYRYSRIWGPTSKFEGERVGPDHVLGDRDIVEIHTA